MSVEEKLVKIAKNTVALKEQKDIDFDAGVAAGKTQRDYEWWDYYQTHQWLDENRNMVSRSGNRTSYGYAFAGIGWDDENYNPIRDIDATNISYDMFAHSGITDTKVAINIANPNNSTNKAHTFRNARWLKTIRKFIVNEVQSMDQQFANCIKLQNLIIEGTIARNAYFQWCPLTKASILSVFAALSDTATGVTAQFKTSAVNTAFETSEGAGDGSTSTEWQALVDSKPNWTIALAEA